MTLTIPDTTMTSDQNPHTTRQAPGKTGWDLSWLPGQTTNRSTAITAMPLAGTATATRLHPGHRLRPHIESWAAGLSATAPARSREPSNSPGTTAAGKRQTAYPIRRTPGFCSAASRCWRATGDSWQTAAGRAVDGCLFPVPEPEGGR